ncbi:MAG: RNA polymerase sigma factor [Planctomycetota bacterium]
MSRVCVELLSQHAAFLRRVALGLVRDEHDAQDVVQETWQHLLAKPPTVETGFRTYLARVATSVVRGWRRSETRREARERTAASDTTVPSAQEVVERLSLQRLIAEKVLALEEPYRTTVLLRYYEDLAPREIAARLSLPVETVKTRQKRALAKLREQLEDEGRERGWSVSALLALMITPSKALVGARSLLLPALITLSALPILVLAWVLVTSRATPQGLVPIAAQQAQQATAAPSMTFASTSDAAREPLAALVPPATSAPQEETFLIHCTEPSGNPVAGATVWVFQHVKREKSEEGRHEPFGPFTTNESGDVLCPLVRYDDEGSYHRFIHARRPGEKVGIAYSAYFPDTSDPPESNDVQVIMLDAVSQAGRVIVPESFDPSLARVRVLACREVAATEYRRSMLH